MTLRCVAQSAHFTEYYWHLAHETRQRNFTIKHRIIK